MESVDRCIAGIDVHKKMLAVVIRKPTGAAVEYFKRKFGTTKNEIIHLVSWIQHSSGKRGGDGIHGELLAASVVRVRAALQTAPHPPAEDPRPTRTQARLSGCSTAGGPVALGRSGRKLRPRRGAAVMALADPVTRTVETEIVGDPRPGGRNPGRGRN